MCNGELPLSRNFSVRKYVNLPRVNKIEKLNEKSRVHVRLRVVFHTLPLFHLRAFARKNYAIVEVNPLLTESWP